MKRMGITLLALFFLSLNTVPCSDIEEEPCGMEIHVHADAPGDQESHTDLCSPFCHCHCCHTHINSQANLTDESLIAPYAEPVESYPFSLGKDITLTLLQPPQV